MIKPLAFTLVHLDNYVLWRWRVRLLTRTLTMWMSPGRAVDVFHLYLEHVSGCGTVLACVCVWCVCLFVSFVVDRR